MTIGKNGPQHAVGNKYEVIFSKDDAFFYAVDFAFDCRSNLLAILEIKDNVGNFSIKLEVNASIFQIF